MAYCANSEGSILGGLGPMPVTIPPPDPIPVPPARPLDAVLMPAVETLVGPAATGTSSVSTRSEEHTAELQSRPGRCCDRIPPPDPIPVPPARPLDAVLMPAVETLVGPAATGTSSVST